MPIDPVSIAQNRLDLAAFRTVLNTWAATINLLITEVEASGGDIDQLRIELDALVLVVGQNIIDIAANTAAIGVNAGNITTNTSNISTNTTNIDLRQRSNSKSTILQEYRPLAASDVLASGDVNAVIHITNSAACTFTFSLGVLPSFVIGQYFIVVNDVTSSDTVNVSGLGGASLVGSGSVAVGGSGYFQKTATNTFLRIY